MRVLDVLAETLTVVNKQIAQDRLRLPRYKIVRLLKPPPARVGASHSSQSQLILQVLTKS